MTPTATFLCQCFRLSLSELSETIKQYDLHTLESLQEKTCAGLGCGCCLAELEGLLKR